MSALYGMQFVGVASAGAGAVYIGKGSVVGIDVGGGRYHGSYKEVGGQLQLDVVVSFPSGGTLVTGTIAPPGTKLNLTATWPKNFADGRPQQVMVNRSPVQVVFEKVGDVS